MSMIPQTPVPGNPAAAIAHPYWCDPAHCHRVDENTADAATVHDKVGTCVTLTTTIYDDGRPNDVSILLADVELDEVDDLSTLLIEAAEARAWLMTRVTGEAR